MAAARRAYLAYKAKKKGPGKYTGPCRACGELGHYAKTCTNRKA